MELGFSLPHSSIRANLSILWYIGGNIDSVEVRSEQGKELLSFNYQYEDPLERNPQLALGRNVLK